MFDGVILNCYWDSFIIFWFELLKEDLYDVEGFDEV